MTFTGFDQSAVDFLAGLKNDNTKTYFDAHREQYLSSIRQPIEDLLGEAEASYGPGRVMRPNRDVRFSKNKEPYRTSASMWAGSVGGVYLSLGIDGLEVGGGVYAPARDQLERARAAIDARPRAASALGTILDELRSRGFEIAGPGLKTAPRGYAKDHPHIDLLRLTHFASLLRLPTDASKRSILDAWSSVKPLIEWTVEHVGAPED